MEENLRTNSEQPQNIPNPMFEIGTKIRWNSVSRDRGKTETPSDRHSPSREWTEFDWGWQEDLEARSNF